MRRKPIVINLFGAPGSGKSTAAAYIFARLKMLGYNCELITEYAKDKTWEGNTTALSCQEYIFGKQSFRMMRCRDKVEIIITDSPLPLGIFYNENPVLDHSYEEMVLKVFYSYHNFNYFLTRCQPYNPIGRNQTQAEADAIGDKIQMFLDDNGIIYEAGLGQTAFYDYIVEDIVDRIGGNNEV